MRAAPRMFCRRVLLLSAGCLLLSSSVPGVPRSLRIVAPAAPGGGWDQTARAMQQALRESGIIPVVQVENVPGAGGTIGLAQFLRSERGNDSALLVTGLVMLSAILTNASPVSLSQATPIARLTGEFEVVAVPASSPWRTMADLVRHLRENPGAVSWGGGSAGGTDHILAGMIASASGVDARRVNYIAYSGGGEAVAALLGSQVSVGISGYGEFGPHIDAGGLRALAISSAERVPGLEIPTLFEQGIEIALVNWRAVVAPPGLTEAGKQALRESVDRMVRSEPWQSMLRSRGWQDQYLAGDELDEFLRTEQVRIARIVRGLRTDQGGATFGSMVFPVLSFGGLAVVGLLLLLQLRRAQTGRVSRSLNSRALLLVGTGVALHLLTLEPGGFVIAGTLLFWFVTRAFGSTRPARDLVLAAGFSTLVFLAFTRGLDLALPAGILSGIFG